MAEPDPYRDPREGERINEERRREDSDERARFAGALRSRLSPRQLVLLLLALSCAAVVAFYVRFTNVSPAPVPPLASTTPASTSRADPAACAQLRADYLAALDKARVCTRDADCIAEPRGRLMTGLDGCGRFATPSKDLLVADDRAQRWQSAGCAGAYRTCVLPRGAICEHQLCVETPHPSAPRSWHRLELPGVYSFFAPADVIDIGLGDLMPEHSWITRFENSRFVLDFDVQ